MLIQPADGSPGIFVDLLQVAAIVLESQTGWAFPTESTPGLRPCGYRVLFIHGGEAIVSTEHGAKLLAELAGK